MPKEDALFLVLEYMSGGPLMEVKMGLDSNNAEPPFDLPQTREYFRQLILGLEYLHSNGVIHRDVSLTPRHTSIDVRGRSLTTSRSGQAGQRLALW